MLKKMWKKVWVKVVGMAPKDRVAQFVFYGFGILFVGVVAYCWVSHFLMNL